MSEFLHWWTHWVTGHPHIQFPLYVSGQKKLNMHRLSDSSSAARIPPSRRGNVSADISGISSSSADAQLAICAASGMSRGGDNNIKLRSDDASSQSATAARICTMSDRGWTEVTNDASKRICSWSTAARKNRHRGACSGLLVMM